jgi:3-hydroxyacyl-CoA dehydrogenase/enoyl-CoA hydratase/3-hydroxybutyryl-CoA epimerase
VSTIRWEQDTDGIVVLTFDDPSRSTNVINDAHIEAMEGVLNRLEAARDRICGVILTSAKRTFFAGTDLTMLVEATRDEAEEVMAWARRVKAQLRRLETLGRPLVAAINGSALGAGLEIALACHRRIAVIDPGTEIGLPEVTLGLLPGGGGVVRTVRLLGLTTALNEVLLRGQRYRPARAAALGLVDELVGTRDDLLPAARAWITANPDVVQPWDAKGHRIPQGAPGSPALAAVLPTLPAMLSARLQGAPGPAPRHILSAAVEGAQVDLDTAFTIESRYFVDLACGQISKNMIQTFFFEVRKAGSDHRATSPPAVRRVGVLGAGGVGAGIAHRLAKAGARVVLADASSQAAAQGRDRVRSLVAAEVAAGRSTHQAGEELLTRIEPGADLTDLAGSDAVIETAFEDVARKRRALAGIEDTVGPGVLVCPATSVVPVTVLAAGLRHPENVVGLHFFAPVDRVPLIEVVRAPGTGSEALDAALGIVRLAGTTPVVVNDSRGFFTSRVLAARIVEGLTMVAEGVAPASIEQASGHAGYPVPVLALLDDLSLSAFRRSRREARVAGEADDGLWARGVADDVLDRMVEDVERSGRAAGTGFYDYADGVRGLLWHGLREHFPPLGGPADVPFTDLVERLMFIEAIESVSCLDEGVLVSATDANVGSVLGNGFPGWTGGVLQYIAGYPGGPDGFAARARQLAARYGERFAPPSRLAEMVRTGYRSSGG